MGERWILTAEDEVEEQVREDVAMESRYPIYSTVGRSYNDYAESIVATRRWQKRKLAVK